ncbi:hypothetical protein [Frigoriflavimonas asaccharolytica]|uniref:Cellulose synthase/poly-beta-1,6-N-acetylglucosamine synthase-like glycosyltransferase n=1 Tax=Frigoriflavimonas asaccharolytica TaxID=2735899 RepID=A0A8J8K9S0_9FLAO|nr:hypothetical protein [Frigoriflavimonas asaccharolytica]NRS94113.1 cellulose synthase/poly-beta-1,6-N-acetylglucosamine synthase-like glycosyltransferase [Frigoriflavimonas asaccharolytica]
MIKMLRIFVGILILYFFVGIVNIGYEFVDLKLILKFPSTKFYYGQIDDQIKYFADSESLIINILPYILIQGILTIIFFKKKITPKKIIAKAIFLFLVLLILLYFLVSVALYYNVLWIYTVIFFLIILINVFLIKLINRESLIKY